MKDYILVLLSVVGIGLVATPNVSVAENQEVASSKVAEVADLSQISTISEKAIEGIAESADITTPVHTASVASAPTSRNTAISNNFEYNVNNYTSGVNVNPGNFINKVSGGRLVYAHNDPALMLSALSLKAGSTFTLVENGTPRTYTVSSARIYSKTELEADVPGKPGRNRMAEIAYSAKDDSGKTHKIALMTCYERTRSAPHRYVVYAD